MWVSIEKRQCDAMRGFRYAPRERVSGARLLDGKGGVMGDNAKKARWRRKKLNKLRNILHRYYGVLQAELTESELKKLNGVLYRLNRGDWPQRSVSKVYDRLGQFRHWILTVPASVTDMIDATDYEPLVKAAGGLVRWAAGANHEPGFRIVPEQQCKNDRESPFHMHIAVSCHRFRQTDRDLAKGFPGGDPLTYWMECCERLFSVRPFVVSETQQSELCLRWTEELGRITGTDVPYSDESVAVWGSWNQVQTKEDRQRLAIYHASPLKTLMDAIGFYVPPKRGDVVRVCYPRSPGGKTAWGSGGYTFPVHEFVRRYVVQPMRIHVRASCYAALSGNSVFKGVLSFGSENGFLDHPLWFFQLLSEGKTWDEAAAAVEKATLDKAPSRGRARRIADEEASTPPDDEDYSGSGKIEL